ncbi:SH3 domain-containing protein [Ahrensia kielensis]|uniref:SH3 domain-containing protein n=1 Tax=Ahrensia kielensis TaxID=76980 RepID=A0ABU9T2L2_9HYPH
MAIKSNIKSTLLVLGAMSMLSLGLPVTSAVAAGYDVDKWAKTTNISRGDHLNIRKWPAAHSQKVASLKRGAKVKVERCIIKSGADWCLISKGRKHGWVNGNFIQRGSYTFATPHPDAHNWH